MTKHTFIGDAPDLREVVRAVGQEGYTTQAWHCFATLTGLCDHVAALERGKAWHKSAWDETSSFYGPPLAQALAMGRDGWQEGATRAAELRERINVARPVSPRLVRYDVAGAVPNVPRALSGNPLNMRRIDAAKARRRPVLSLVVACGANASVAADAFMNRAGVLAAVIDAIESADYSVELIGANVSVTGSFLCGNAFRLKAAGDSVDIARVAYGLGHVAIHRRLFFAIFGGHYHNKPLGDGLGMTIGHAAGDGTYIVDTMRGSSLFATPRDAETRGMDSIIAELARQGCPGFADRAAA